MLFLSSLAKKNHSDEVTVVNKKGEKRKKKGIFLKNGLSLQQIEVDSKQYLIFWYFLRKVRQLELFHTSTI